MCRLTVLPSYAINTNAFLQKSMTQGRFVCSPGDLGRQRRMLLGSSWHEFTARRQQPAMEVGKYLENLKTDDCVILFLSQVMCGWCSPPCGREGGAWLRREAVEFTHSSPAGL